MKLARQLQGSMEPGTRIRTECQNKIILFEAEAPKVACYSPDLRKVGGDHSILRHSLSGFPFTLSMLALLGSSI